MQKNMKMIGHDHMSVDVGIRIMTGNIPYALVKNPAGAVKFHNIIPDSAETVFFQMRTGCYEKQAFVILMPDGSCQTS